MKVLISAYSCEPGRGSEPGVGWNWALQIGRFHEIWVVTRPCHRTAIQEAIEKCPVKNIHWIYFDLPRWTRWWYNKDQSSRFHYYVWQICAYFMGKSLHREVGFDLAHHVTTACYWMPSFLALLPIPFVWGPVGGGESAPRAFYSSRSPKGRRYERLRDIARTLAHFDPFLRLTARRSVYALAQTGDTEKQHLALGCRNVLIYSNSGLSADEINCLKLVPVRRDGPFRVFSVGSLLHLKGFDLGVSAFAELHRQFPRSEYWVIGEGPEKDRLEQLASELGVRQAVVFCGVLPRSDLLEKLSECDVLLHPSLHDAAGVTCLEAMAAGRPVVCLDLGGPSLQVIRETGIKVPALSPTQVIRDLATALSQLAANPDLRLQLGQAGRRRVLDHFTYSKKAEHLMEIYQGAVRITAHAD
jgi:glycosyltransferase involved in cell wall biosynthesis